MLKRQEPIPFYRNVKLLGMIAQVAFAVAVLIVVIVLARNVVQGLETLNVRTGFGFLDDPAGFDISESPIQYDKDRSFGYALLVGVLNTLKVSLLGVVLATLLGIVAALMRLSKNWLLRNIATWYIEAFRNTPLVVQLFLWFSVLLIPSLPSGVNAYNIFGAAYVNNSSGIVIPWLYTSNNFSLWLPWLAAAIAVAIVIYIIQRAILARLEQLPQVVTSPTFLAIVALLTIGGFGYWQAWQHSSHPSDLALEYNDKRGRLTAFHDSDADGKADRDEIGISAVPVRISIAEGQLDTTPAKRTDQRQERRSTFGFPPLQTDEFSEAIVHFQNEDLNDAYKIHYTDFPSLGVIYQDRNTNGVFDKGEELDEAGEGFEGRDFKLVMDVQGFSRRVVTGQDGEIRVPDFDAPAELELLHSSPLVLSLPSFFTDKSSVNGGAILSVPYLALLLALVFYTASFIAEIVRGGILAVPKGQNEAASALGLNAGQRFRLIVFPQAFRIIIPPTLSQYLNLIKNSSLGMFCSYPDFFVVANTVNNQSGASMPIILLLIGGYLLISLTFSLLLNAYNTRVQLIER